MLALFRYILLICIFHPLVCSLNDEGSALISFKKSIDEDPNGSMKNWNFSDANPCFWNGITCQDQRVVSVSIPKKKLKGSLSPSLASLSELRHVNLRNNKLSGTLPSELFNVLGLQSLVLSGNSFSGSLSNEIGKLEFLQTLDLSRNFFNGSLPVSLVECKRMRTLDLSRNNFTGSLPKGFGDALISLEELNLSFNKFSGPISNDLGNLSNLQGTMDLSHNQFSGSIPASLGDLPEKVYIDLTYNNLSGAIPQNGALMNRGPTAFIGNPNLCGPPLKNPCSDDVPSPFPYLPSSYPSQNGTGKHVNGRGLSKGAVVSIIAGDVVGICLIGLIFSYCYTRVCPCRKRRRGANGYGFAKERRGGKRECLCFRRDESETLSENVEQYDLVPLDTQVGFDLDDLLKASAFVLGKSGIGIVYKVVLQDGLTTLAVRRLGEGGSQRFKEFQTEVEAVGKLRHPNFVTLRAYYWSVDEKLLIYDFIPNGNLAIAIHGKAGMISFTPLPWSIRLKIMKGIAKGLAYLHEYSPKKYVHGDLKPSNILLGEDMEPKISNFGLGRLANIAGSSPTVQSNRIIISERTHQRQSSNVPSEVPTSIGSNNAGSYYQAPEALKIVKPSQKWDVYSYGVVLLEMLSGKPPIVHVGTSELDLVNWIQLCIEEKKPLAEVLDPCLGECGDNEEEIITVLKIAMACIQSGPERRPTMRHISEALERLGDCD